MSEKGLPVEKRIFGVGEYLRPSFIEPFDCENILIEGAKIVQAPFWVIHPIKSKNVTIDGVIVESHGPNNDGCDPEYSKNVVIKNCTFNTGDDCIAIKSGRNEDGRRVGIPSENIVIQNRKMIDGHGGVVIGSEGNYLESTGTCMFTYTLAKGVNMGYLPERYMAQAKKGYGGILKEFITVQENGVVDLNKCCGVAGLGVDPYRDGSFDYYVNEIVSSNDSKGTGPFMMASLELEK